MRVITVSGEDCTSPNPDDAPEVDFVLGDEELFFGPGEGVVADEDVSAAPVVEEPIFTG